MILLSYTSKNQKLLLMFDMGLADQIILQWSLNFLLGCNIKEVDVIVARLGDNFGKKEDLQELDFL